MTMPVLPFIGAVPSLPGEQVAPGAAGDQAATFGSLLTSLMPAAPGGAPSFGLTPDAGLAANSLASVPIVAGAVSLGAVSGDPVVFVSGSAAASLPETTATESVEQGETSALDGVSVECPGAPTADAIALTADAIAPTADATVPAVAPDMNSRLAFVPIFSGSAPAAAESVGAPGTTPNAAMTKLQPEFADRLHRVVERMEREFGYRVEVVESVRTQSRQDALYAQGRERPGPVVTWTRNSRHIEGFAADVVIDGTYGNAAAYRVLAQVARAEGLRTLGPRDPGHIELPRTSSSPTTISDNEVLPAQPRDVGSFPMLEPTRLNRVRDVVASYRSETGRFPAAPQPAAPAFEPVAVGINAPVMPVAAQARVDTVATVASVATLAAVPVPGRAVPAPSPNAPLAPRDRSTSRRTEERMATAGNRDLSQLPGVPATGPDEHSTRLAVEPAPGSDIDRDQQPLAERPDFIESTDVTSPLASPADPSGRMTPETRGTSGERTISPILSERITELLNLRDAAAERPLSSVLLRLDSPDGTEDRIRIGLRGNSLDAAFEMTDRLLVEDLNRHVNELARAVERQGFDPERLTVRSSGARDNILAQAVAGEREGLRAASAGGANTGTAGSRDGRAPRHDDQPDHPPRQRPRRDSHGDR